MRPLACLLFLLTVLAACSSPPPAARDLPPWAQGPARTVDGGYIVFVASGEDHSPGPAAQKAEGAALQDLANECSLIPLGTRLEDRAISTENRLRTAYAKVAVEFETCEEAKRARTPERVRQIANVAMTEQLKRYQDMVDEPTEVASLVTAPSDGPAAPIDGATAGGPPPVQSEFQYFLVRQQVAYEKQVVVLAPPTAFAPGSPETTQFTHAVAITQPSLAAYESAHPAPRTTNAVWTTYRGRAASTARAQKFSRAPGMRTPRLTHETVDRSGVRRTGGHHHHGR